MSEARSPVGYIKFRVATAVGPNLDKGRFFPRDTKAGIYEAETIVKAEKLALFANHKHDTVLWSERIILQ